MYALDLFSGIGGNSLGLKDYIKTIAYCESDRHAQAVLLSRMSIGDLPIAPICTDITQLDGRLFKGKVDIIIAGFPCQDISIAGNGIGLEGKRSILFFEIMRLARQIQSTFIFLENVNAIRTRGLDTVIQELTEAGYDCRWTMLSAASVGAPHKRERWFLLAHSKGVGSRGEVRNLSSQDAEEQRSQDELEDTSREFIAASKRSSVLAYSEYDGRLGDEIGRVVKEEIFNDKERSIGLGQSEGSSSLRMLSNKFIQTRQQLSSSHAWWAVEPNVGRLVDGIPFRVERLKRLGNAVVPQQVKKAFEILMGIKPNELASNDKPRIPVKIGKIKIKLKQAI